jgi:Tfp pilus assembly protein PilF
MSNNTELVQQGIAAVKAGDLAAARLLFANVLQTEPENEVAWLWLSGAVASNAERKRRAGGRC